MWFGFTLGHLLMLCLHFGGFWVEMFGLKPRHEVGVWVTIRGSFGKVLRCCKVATRVICVVCIGDRRWVEKEKDEERKVLKEKEVMWEVVLVVLVLKNNLLKIFCGLWIYMKWSSWSCELLFAHGIKMHFKVSSF